MLTIVAYSACLILLITLYADRLRWKHIKQLTIFIEQSEQVKTDKEYQGWTNEINIYLNKHFNQNYQLRFNQIRQYEHASLHAKFDYELDGRLIRLSEFIFELKKTSSLITNMYIASFKQQDSIVQAIA